MGHRSRLLPVLKSGTFILLSKMHSMRSSGRWAWVGPLPFLHRFFPRSHVLHPSSRTVVPDISRSSSHERRSADIVLPSMLPICWQAGSAHPFRCLSGMVLSISSTSEDCLRYLSVLVKGG